MKAAIAKDVAAMATIATNAAVVAVAANTRTVVAAVAVMTATAVAAMTVAVANSRRGISSFKKYKTQKSNPDGDNSCQGFTFPIIL